MKVHALGHNFCGLMSGHWSTVRELCSKIEQDQLDKCFPDTADEVLERISASSDKFCASALCPPNTAAQILVSGFIGKNPLLLSVLVDNKAASVNIRHDQDAIGEGDFAALMMLRYRAYDPLNASLEEASYLIYESKKFSENVSSVGPRTNIKIHLPLRRPGFQFSEERRAAEEYNWYDLSEETMRVLEEKRKQFFLQPVERFDIPDSAAITSRGGLQFPKRSTHDH